MIATFRDGGRQYRVAEGQTILLDLRDKSPGDMIEIEEVLSVEDGAGFHVGRPLLENARVTAKVLERARGPKLIYNRFRRRKGSRTRGGHRQKYLKVSIESISIGSIVGS